MKKMIFLTNFILCAVLIATTLAFIHYSADLVRVLRIINGMLLVGFYFFAISAATEFIISKITKHIEKIDPECPQDCDVYDELSPILVKTQRRNAASENEIAKLKKRKKQFDTITRNMHEGLVILDLDYRILSCNKTALDILDGENSKRENDNAEEEIQNLTGKHVLVLCRDEKFRQGIKFTDDANKIETIIEIRGKTIRMFAGLIINKEKKTGIAILLMDISEQADREKLRREFSANVSHELKTPLAVISGYSEIMANGIAKPEDIKDFSGKIYAESQHLLNLINDIIQLSNLDENSDFSFEKVNLYEFTQNALKQISEKAAEREITCELTGNYISSQPAGKNTEINAIPRLLDVILQNLLVNAVKYNRDGGKITVKVEAGENTATLCVTDTGIGIPLSMQHRVFERFFRVDSARSQRQNGTGLGLSIVKHAVQIHKGTINLSSTEGKGTTITVEFPIPSS